MKVNLIKVSRYDYDDKNGANHKGSTFECLVPTVDKSALGYDVRQFRCDYMLYDTLVQLFNQNKPVELDLEFVPMRNGNYYSRLKKINDIEL